MMIDSVFILSWLENEDLGDLQQHLIDNATFGVENIGSVLWLFHRCRRTPVV